MKFFRSYLNKTLAKFGIPLAAKFVNTSVENCTNIFLWFKLNTTGISFMHSDVTQLQVESTCSAKCQHYTRTLQRDGTPSHALSITPALPAR